MSVTEVEQLKKLKNMAKLNPYLNFDGTCEEAFLFYRSVFGGEFRGEIFKMKDIPDMEIPAGALPEIYSYGHRNPQGVDIHPVTRELWLSEMGPRGGDEINLIKPGKNYGWPEITYGIEYSGAPISEGATQKEGMEQPVYYWDPVLSPSGMAFYTSNEIPEWQNNLFIGGLSSKHIARIVLKDNRVIGEERLLSGENQRFRDIGNGKDGALYAVTDEGRLYRIARK
jgi:glucose/arabinose dehydrogenase